MGRLRLLIVLVGAVLTGAALAPPPASAAPSPAAERYWVVGEPKDGQREYLYQIAMQTLGDGNRYQEIVALNRGRPQPDGGRLADALTPLRPGWILRLPPDAAGPGVRTGSPPVADPGRPEAGGGRVLALAVPAVGVTAAAGLVLWRRARQAPPAVEPPPDGPVRLTTDLEPLATEPGHRLDVRLLGANGSSGVPPYTWMKGDPPPAARLPIVLGRRAGRELLLDLAAAPDVLTITGRMPLIAPQAAELAGQAIRNGAAVIVVGGVLGGDAPAGAMAAADFPSAVTAVDRIPGPVLVISGGLRGADLAAARALADRTGRRAVPVLIGEVLRARWSVTVNRVRSATVG